MYIAGMGIIFNRGRGLDILEKALEDGWVNSGSVYGVPEEVLKDKIVLKDARRADDFSKMAILAAHDALADSGLGEKIKPKLGIILATAFGPHATTFRFLDDILNFGDAQVSPTLFSHSVHNAAVSYIASTLQSRGPTLTITQFADSFQQALILADSWLEEKRCEYILVGSVDQVGKVMEYIVSQKLKLAPDGKIRSFNFSKEPECIPGEGSAFFLVTNNQKDKKYCAISGVTSLKEKPDLTILDSDGFAGDESLYREVLGKGTLVSSCAPIFGSMLTLSSFSAVAAALMLKKQKFYASPVRENPHNLNLCVENKAGKINSISCLRYDCNAKSSIINLRN